MPAWRRLSRIRLQRKRFRRGDQSAGYLDGLGFRYADQRICTPEWCHVPLSSASQREDHREFRSVPLSMLRASRRNRLLAIKAKPAPGNRGGPWRRMKGWDPLLLFPRGVWTKITIRESLRILNHKPACFHHNPVHCIHLGLTRSRLREGLRASRSALARQGQ